MALLALFVSFATVIADLGLTTALVRAPSLTAPEVSTAFWMSAATGASLTVLGLLLAHPIATAVGAPELGNLAAVMSCGIVVAALGVAPTALLVKQLAFARLLVIGATGATISGAVAIAMAVAGQGVWALAAQSLVMSVVTALGAWIAVGFWPHRAWSPDAARRLLGTGKFVLAANICDVSYSRIQNLLVGSLFGPARLAYYLRADSTQQLPADAASSVISRVALPVFSESGDNAVALRNGLRTSIRTAVALNAPAMSLLAALSAPVVEALYGAAWAPAAPLLTILCLGGLLWPLHVLNINLLYALGRSREVFRIDLQKKAFALCALGVGATFGLTGVAWAQVATGVFAIVVNGHAVGGQIGFGTKDQLGCAWAPISLSLVVGVAVFGATRLLHTTALTEVATLALLGGLAYLALSRILAVSAVTEAVAMLRIRGAHS